jgi:hypothetical protein
VSLFNTTAPSTDIAHRAVKHLAEIEIGEPVVTCRLNFA